MHTLQNFMRVKTMKKTIIWILVFFLVTSIALAQDCSYNYDDPNLDWSQVPDYCILTIPPEKLDYSKLSQAQRVMMSPEQIIANLDNIEDLSKDVDPLMAMAAISEKYNIIIFGMEGSFKIRNDQLISKDKTMTLTDPFYTKKDIVVIIDKEVAGISSESPINPKDLPKEDSFYIIETEVIFEFEGQEHTFFSTLINSDGKLFATPGSYNNFNGLSITPSKIIELSFGEEKENTLSIIPSQDGKSLSILNNDPENALSLGLGSINEGLLGSTINPGSSIPSLDITTGKGKVIVTNRQEENLASQVQIFSEEDPLFSIKNGRKIISYDEGKLVYSTNPKLTTTSIPLSIELYDKNGNPLIIKNNQPQKLIFSKFSEVAIISSTRNTGLSEIVSPNEASVLISENLLLDDQRYTPETFKAEFPDIILSGRIGQNEVLALTEVLRNLPEDYAKSVNLIEFYGDKIKPSLLIHELLGLGAAGYARPVVNTIGIEKESGESVIAHELAHTYTFMVEAQDALKSFEYFTPTIGGGISRKGSPPLGFRELWLETAGDVYRKDLKIINTEWEDGFDLISMEWDDGTSGPRYGFVRPYGSFMYYEDVATWVEEIYKSITILSYDYETFGKMFHPDNPDYKKSLRKLYLLRRYGFITPEQYDSVLEGAENYLITNELLEAPK